MSYHDKLAGLAARFKLRIRAYGNPPIPSSTFRFEVKARFLSNIRKLTADVTWDEFKEAELAIRHRRLPPSGLLHGNNAFREFFRLVCAPSFFLVLLRSLPIGNAR